MTNNDIVKEMDLNINLKLCKTTTTTTMNEPSLL